jgi:hypothetical protein
MFQMYLIISEVSISWLESLKGGVYVEDVAVVYERCQ